MAYQKKFVPKLFKWRHFQPDIILLCVRWYLSYRLSYSGSSLIKTKLNQVQIELLFHY